MTKAKEMALLEAKAYKKAIAKVKRRAPVEITVDNGHYLAVLDGLKTCVTASEPLTREGEDLVLKEQVDRVTVTVRLILKMPLWFVTSHLWLKEGYKDATAFETAWLKRYGKLITNQEVYVHVIAQC